MSIYTKNGDDGFTQRIDGESVRKCHPRIETIGAVDELNSFLGLCLCKALQAELPDQAKLLGKLQNELFIIGTQITTAGTEFAIGVTDEVPENSIAYMEDMIDKIWEELGPLESFILPGGCELACHLHVGRTLCRRAERAIAAMQQEVPEIPSIILRYLNRQSDLLFALARQVNKIAGLDEAKWKRNGN